jgi:hypothetical protein
MKAICKHGLLQLRVNMDDFTFICMKIELNWWK